jgi:hypothetical protein
VIENQISHQLATFSQRGQIIPIAEALLNLLMTGNSKTSIAG